MKIKRNIQFGLAGLLAFAACSKDEPVEFKNQPVNFGSRGAEQDSTVSDTTYHGVTVNTDWDGKTHIFF